jgi:hypothetical protein
MELGIRYLDTAYSYGNGKSEERVGRAIAGRRKNLWIATKIPDRTYDGFMRTIEGSLKRVGTDHFDLVHIHSLLQADDLAAIEAPAGCLKALYKIREQKSRASSASPATDPERSPPPLGTISTARNGAQRRPGRHDERQGGMIINPERQTSREGRSPVALKKNWASRYEDLRPATPGVAPLPSCFATRSLPSAPPSLACPNGVHRREYPARQVLLAIVKPNMKDMSDKLSHHKVELDRFFRTTSTPEQPSPRPHPRVGRRRETYIIAV